MAYEFNRFNNPSPSEMRGRFSGQNLPQWLQGTMIYNGPGTTDSPLNAFRIQSGGSNVSFMRNSSPIERSNQMENSRYSTPRMSACNCYHFSNFSSGPFNAPSSFGDVVDVSRFINIRTGTPLQDRFGDYYNLGASFGTGNKYHIMKNSSNDFSRDARIVASIPSRFPNHIGYFHTYGITDNHLIFCEQPWAFDVNKMRQVQSQDRIRDCVSFVSGEKNYFHIVDKRNGRRLGLNYVTDSPYSFFKFMNCTESSDRIVIDILCYNGSPDRYNCCYGGSGSPDTHTLRFEFPLNSLSSNSMTIRPMNQSLGFNYPMVSANTRFNSSSQYDYKICMDEMRNSQFGSGSQYGSSVVKINRMSSEKMYWRPDNGSFNCPQGVSFIQNPNGRFDDDGVLICYVSNSRNSRDSYLVFIDPKNMMEMSRVYYDEPIAFGNHTTYKM